MIMEGLQPTAAVQQPPSIDQPAMKRPLTLEERLSDLEAEYSIHTTHRPGVRSSTQPMFDLQFLLDFIQNDVKSQPNMYGVVDLDQNLTREQAFQLAFGEQNSFDYLQYAGPKTFQNLKQQAYELSIKLNDRTAIDSVTSFLNTIQNISPQLAKDLRECDAASVKTFDDFKNLQLSNGETLENYVRSATAARNKRRKSSIDNLTQKNLQSLWKAFQPARDSMIDKENLITYGMSQEERDRSDLLKFRSFDNFLSQNVLIDDNLLYMAALHGETNLFDLKDVMRFSRDVHTSEGPDRRYEVYRTSVKSGVYSERDMLSSVYGEAAVQRLENHQNAMISFQTEPPEKTLARLIKSGESPDFNTARMALTDKNGNVLRYTKEDAKKGKIPKGKEVGWIKVVARDVDLTELTVGQIQDMQNSKPPKMFAAGGYQFTKIALNNLIERGIVRRDEKFTVEVQNRCFVEMTKSSSKVIHLDKAFAAAYKNNQTQLSEATIRELTNKIAKIWASVKSTSGKSLYEDSGNRGSIGNRNVRDTLQAAYKEYSSLQKAQNYTHDDAYYQSLTGIKKPSRSV